MGLPLRSRGISAVYLSIYWVTLCIDSARYLGGNAHQWTGTSCECGNKSDLLYVSAGDTGDRDAAIAGSIDGVLYRVSTDRRFSGFDDVLPTCFARVSTCSGVKPV